MNTFQGGYIDKTGVVSKWPSQPKKLSFWTEVTHFLAPNDPPLISIFWTKKFNMFRVDFTLKIYLQGYFEKTEFISKW